MTKIDPVAEALREAARLNDADACERHYGRAAAANLYVNAEVLRIAAESQSYDAFERMLEIAGKDACGVTTVTCIALGPDWSRVQELGKTDARLGAALRKYDETVDANIGRMFEEIGIDREALRKNVRALGLK